jgi:hypothetical protein
MISIAFDSSAVDLTTSVLEKMSGPLIKVVTSHDVVSYVDARFRV